LEALCAKNDLVAQEVASCEKSKLERFITRHFLTLYLN